MGSFLSRVISIERSTPQEVIIFFYPENIVIKLGDIKISQSFQPCSIFQIWKKKQDSGYPMFPWWVY